MREQEERDEEKRKAIKALIKVDKINERQRLFALYYFQTHNATASYQRAYGCTRAAASASAYKLLRNPAIIATIREALAKQLNAKLIYCESTREECLARAKERGVFAADWEKYVRRWWNEYEP